MPFHVKHRPQLGLFCPACNPLTRRRRRRARRRVRDNAHVIWADKLAQQAKRDRLRKQLDDIEWQHYSSVPPWVRELSGQVTGDIISGKQLLIDPPRQHGLDAL
jgi:hypothetical protein